MINYIYENNNIILKNPPCFDLADTLNCGQAFRWSENPDHSWQGVAKNRFLKISKEQNDVILHNVTPDKFDNIWADYFDLDRDYQKIIDSLSENEVLNKAIQFSNGIRILNQDPWETLCSFIISQNNNIPRIKGIIDRLTKSFGEKITDDYYSFPSAEVIASLNLEDLAPLRCGFRGKYILDAAKKVASGEVDLNSLYSVPLDTALASLTTIYGVGEKVASCVLLFSLKHIDAFPKDVWIKKAMQKLFGGELPDVAKPFAGIAQQYIFHYARCTNLK